MQLYYKNALLKCIFIFLQNYIMERLFEYAGKLLKKTNTDFVRYLYYQVNWENQLIGIIGPRGVGKTTLVLQYIKMQLPVKESLYVTAEDFYFTENRLVDLADEFVKYGGKYLFIDEIHKYPNWSRELKLIYDYHKDLKIVFTGSSLLDIKQGSADLSRRSVMYFMKGMSFREYLALFHQIEVPVYSFDQILTHDVDITNIDHPLPLFSSYLKKGFYPFSLENDHGIKLKQIIDQTLEVDIPFYANMNVSTGRKLKHLLSIISQSVPFKPNMSKIAEMMNASRNNISDYLLYLEEAGLIAQLREDTKGIRSLGKVSKIYLENTNLIHNLAYENPDRGNIRETFFYNQLRVLKDVNLSRSADFKIDDIHFEIGGRSKDQEQIRSLQNGFLIKDDIENGYLNTIPLWHFGLMY